MLCHTRHKTKTWSLKIHLFWSLSLQCHQLFTSGRFKEDVIGATPVHLRRKLSLLSKFFFRTFTNYTLLKKVLDLLLFTMKREFKLGLDFLLKRDVYDADFVTKNHPFHMVSEKSNKSVFFLTSSKIYQYLSHSSTFEKNQNVVEIFLPD